MDALFEVGPSVRKAAVLSPCGTYRYELTRTWGAGKLVGWVMLNPSKADAEVDDPTIRRCMGFARAWGYNGIVVRNLYALRATDPRELWQHPDPVGPDNHRALASAGGEALTVCAWGSNADPVRAQAVVGSLIIARATLRCLGVTKDGQPRHPLYVRGDTVLAGFGDAAA